MTIGIYPDIILEQDLSPASTSTPEIDDDCHAINKATKGLGANKQKTMDALATKDGTERCKMAVRYPELYGGQSLSELMKKEFRGDFGTAMTMLAMPLDESEAYMLKSAFKGVGCNVQVVYSILTGRTNEELNIVKKKFFKLYTKDLGKVVASELHGDMERLVFNCLQSGEEEYDEQYHTDDKAKDDAEFIYKKGQGKFFGTDEKSIFKVLCAAPPQYLEKVNKAYTDKYDVTLFHALEKELSGNVKDGTIHMLGMKLRPYETIAKLIKSACAGIGTDELLLTTCIIRYQHVMHQVQTAHIELFGKTIHERVRHEAGGDYKKLLLAVLNTVWPEDA